MRSFSDIIGISLSSICAIQCVLLPLALSFSAIIPNWAHFGHSWPALILIGVVALWSFSRGYIRHRKTHIITIAFIGYACLILGAIFDRNGIELPLWVLFGSGGVLLVIAHWKNYRATECRVAPAAKNI
ncbi:MerC domain-containing protein [Marinicella sp. W31]|uniref:MerC domain-containing protein n=1 Tax=Marinicella sp. W31 TaxID=3023713 RepID=UPI0037578D28